ncbi:MAG: hypothetical protein ACOCX4_02535, partial [Planctomycetota bacterium]
MGRTGIGAVLLLGLMWAAGNAEAADGDAPWKRLLANDAAVSPAFDAPLDALEAGFYAAKVRADYAAAYEYALACLRRTASRPDGLVDLRRTTGMARQAGRRIAVREALLALREAEDTAPVVRLAIRDYLLDDAMQRRAWDGPAGVDALVRDDGWVRRWARVVGPFRDHKPYQLDDTTPFESAPGQDAYTDTLGRSPRVLSDVGAAVDGPVRLRDHLPQGWGGAAYLVAAIRTDAA